VAVACKNRRSTTASGCRGGRRQLTRPLPFVPLSGGQAVGLSSLSLCLLCLLRSCRHVALALCLVCIVKRCVSRPRPSQWPRFARLVSCPPAIPPSRTSQTTTPSSAHLKIRLCRCCCPHAHAFVLVCPVPFGQTGQHLHSDSLVPATNIRPVLDQSVTHRLVDCPVNAAVPTPLPTDVSTASQVLCLSRSPH